jgi:hypothetical protein
MPDIRPGDIIGYRAIAGFTTAPVTLSLPFGVTLEDETLIWARDILPPW